MSYEVKQDTVTPEQWEEMRQIAAKYVCAECGADLTVHTVPANGTLEVGCLKPDHHGWVERTSLTQEFRRGSALPVGIDAAIEKRMLPADLGRAMNLLSVRYPRAIVDRPTAALFVIDCSRLGLDPLISPAEAVPIPFISNKGTPQQKVSVQMIVTIDGWLSMAARGSPERWAGPPSVEPVFDEKVAESLSGDPKAWVYIATGRTALKTGLSEPTTAYGYFTKAEFERARYNKTPAATNPGNQAATRAVKRWARQNFPECRQRMMELTADWRQRAKGIKDAEDFVDAEYSVLDKEEGGKPPAKKLVAPAGPEGSEGEKKSAAPGATREAEVVGEESAGDFSELEQGKGKKSEGPAAEGAWQTPDDVTEDDIPDYNALFRACAHFYHDDKGKPLQPDQVAKQMGYRVSKDLFSSRISPWDIWLNIKKLNE